MPVEKLTRIVHAADQLTCSISFDETESDEIKSDEIEAEPPITVTISGEMNARSGFITGAILTTLAGHPGRNVIVDVRNMIFRQDVVINERAIECVFELLGYLISKSVDTVVIIDNDFLRDILAMTFRRRRGRAKVTILPE